MIRTRVSEKTNEKKKKTSPDYSAWARRILQPSGDEALSKLPPGLYVVSTPIGNLGDITLRALEILAAVDGVACEDTRVTGGLLQRYGIKKPLISYHDHNAEARLPELMKRLAAGEALALVSDAGTPLVSDPGFRLVRACRAAGHAVIAAPGASAVLTALATAGLPTDRFFFAGFLPARGGARKKALAEWAGLAATLVFYEAPQRLAETLEDMAEIFGASRGGAVARELTKLFEETRRGTLGELAKAYQAGATPKGEIVILIAPPEGETGAEADIEELLREALKKMSLRDAVAAVVEATGAKKAEVYKRALGVKA